jgi:hypothetical protein
MKAVFGILSLVVVLAALAFVARKQLQAVDGASMVGRSHEAERKARALAAEPAGAEATKVGAGTVPQQARSMAERARDNTARSLEQGAERTRRADEP